MLDAEIDELERLRRTNRDLAACLSLPALCAGRDRRYIVTTLVDVLANMLEPELAYVAIRDAEGRVTLEEWRPRMAARPGAIAQAIAQPDGDVDGAVQATAVEVPGIGRLRLVRAPLSIPNSRGVAVVAAARDNFPTERDTTLLRVLATQAGIALQNAELLAREAALLAREQAAVGFLQQLQVVTETALSGGTPTELLHALLRRIRTVLGTDTATILLLDESGACLYPVASDGLPEEPGDAAGVPLDAGVAGRIARRDEGMIIDDLGSVEVVRPVLRLRLRSLMGVPLKVDGRLIGVIHVGTVAPRKFTTDDLSVLRLVAERAALVSDHARRAEAERAARAAIETAEAQLRLALDAGRMGTWEWNIRTGEVAWSENLEPIHGLAPGTFGGTFEAFQGLIHADDRDIVLQAIARSVERRADYDIEFRNVWPDGTVHWMAGKGRVFTDAQGEPVRVIGIGMDITERKRAEEKFHLAVEAAPVAMVVVDRHGTIRLVNALTERLLGYARHELVGQSVECLVPPRFRDRHAGDRTHFFADPRRRPMGAGRELYALRKDGAEVPVEIGLSPFETADGTFVLATITDITERKQAEAERERLLVRERAAREAAEAAQARLDFVGQIARSITSALDLDTVLQRVAEGAQALCGSDTAAIFLRDGDSNAMVPRYRVGPEIAEYQKLRIEPGRGLGGQVLLTGRAARTADYLADGRITADYHAIGSATGARALMVVPLLVADRVEGLLYVNHKTARPFTDEDEMVCVRLADQAAVAIANADLYDEARRANRAKDQFLAMLSHELRQPLNAMLGWLRVLRSQRIDAVQQERALDAIERSTKAQARMIDDLLDIARIEAGKVALDRRAMAVGPLVADIIDSLQHEAKAKGLTLRTAIDTTPGLVSADADRVRQVVMNVLGNAMKYTPTGGRIDVRTTSEDSVIRIVVSDTGIGIEPDVLPHVFERFRQADWRAAGTQGGLGLGLAIVREIVEMHGGTVEARSDGRDRGATFIVTLPTIVAADSG